MEEKTHDISRILQIWMGYYLICRGVFYLYNRLVQDFVHQQYHSCHTIFHHWSGMFCSYDDEEVLILSNKCGSLEKWALPRPLNTYSQDAWNITLNGTQTWCSWASSNSIYQSASWTLFPFYQVFHRYIQSHIPCHWNAVNSDKQVYPLCITLYEYKTLQHKIYIPYTLQKHWLQYTHVIDCDCTLTQDFPNIRYRIHKKDLRPPPSPQNWPRTSAFLSLASLPSCRNYQKFPWARSKATGFGVPVSKNYVEPAFSFAEPTQPVTTTTESDMHIQYIPQPIQHSETRTTV